MRTVVVGNRGLAKAVLVHLLETDWHVVGAVSPGDNAARRQAGYTPFDDIVERHDLELIQTDDINDETTREQLSDLEPDLCICPGWHQIIDHTVLDIPDRGFIGFHASDLPGGRGGAPVNWALIHGQSDITLSLFYYTPGVDAGDVIQQGTVTIEERDDVDTLLDKLSLAACDALSATRDDLEADTVTATPQSRTEATYRPRRQPQDGLIDWKQPASELVDWIRAQTDPYPGAYTFYYGNHLIVWSADLITRSTTAESGTVVSIADGDGLDVATGDGVLRLKRIELADSPRLWADNFAIRYDISTGESFGREQAPSSWLYTGIRDSDGGTDFTTASSLTADECGSIQAVVAASDHRQIDLTARLDDDVVHSEQITVEGYEAVPITYDPDAPGISTLRVEFLEGGTQVDVRYLKVFVTA